jgi:hypothetical protein
MTPETILCIHSIALLPPDQTTRDHLGFIDNKSDRPVAGHCHRGKEICICIEKEKLSKTLIWHEAAHALHIFYDSDKEICYQWALMVDVGGAIFGETRRGPDQIFPCDGFLTRYGSRNAEEDIAVWVEAIFAAKIMDRTEIFRHAPKVDIYHRKLQFLLDYKFIAQKEYNFIKPLIS